MSLVAQEAMDCFQVGPGLPPKWPYRLTPDHSDQLRVGERGGLFKASFSMDGDTAIAYIELTAVAQQPLIRVSHAAWGASTLLRRVTGEKRFRAAMRRSSRP